MTYWVDESVCHSLVVEQSTSNYLSQVLLMANKLKNKLSIKRKKMKIQAEGKVSASKDTTTLFWWSLVTDILMRLYI